MERQIIARYINGQIYVGKLYYSYENARLMDKQINEQIDDGYINRQIDKQMDRQIDYGYIICKILNRWIGIGHGLTNLFKIYIMNYYKRNNCIFNDNIQIANQ